MKRMMRPPLAGLMMVLVLAAAAAASDCPALSTGQTLYVPAYSHIYAGHKQRPYLLTVTLSIRNIDPAQPLFVSSVEYYKTDGVLLKQYLTEPVRLDALASTRFIVPLQDKEGGSGANFIVKWHANARINPPVVEAVMIGTQSQQGISFTSRGQVIIETP